MKAVLITVSILLTIAWLIDDVVHDANKYKYDKMHDSIVMYKDCCLRCNTEILESNERFER